MNGNNSYSQRNSGRNLGEELFEQYCESKQVFFRRLGFDEKILFLIFIPLVLLLGIFLTISFVVTKAQDWLVSKVLRISKHLK